MRIVLYGLGRSGLAAGRLASTQGHTVWWFDADPAPADRLAAQAAGWEMASPKSHDVDLCIAAPGVAIDHPDLVSLRRRGIETIGEIEWVARTVAPSMVGVTGTAGKGTVTRWTEAFMIASGIDAVAGGNLDPAASAVARHDAWLVAELSSFQLERSPTIRPKVAVVTRLGRDHLDRHGTVEAYHAVKTAMTAHMGRGDTVVLDADDPFQRTWPLPVDADVVRYASLEGWTDRSRARLGIEAYRRGDALFLCDVCIGTTADLPHPGRPTIANALAAALAAHRAGASIEAIRTTLPRLTPSHGRFDTVAERHGVRFVEDSIATRDVAVAAALEAATPPIAWIVGGRDKGSDAAALRDAARGKVAVILGIGESGRAYVEALGGIAPSMVFEDGDGYAELADAVRAGAELVRSRGGGTVLLAPLGASFDRFASYRERGDAFRSIVTSLTSEAAWTDLS